MSFRRIKLNLHACTLWLVIFARDLFISSQEPFAKMKTAKFLLSTCEASEPRFNPAYFKLSSRPITVTGACQRVSLYSYRSSHSGNRTATQAQTHEPHDRVRLRAEAIVSTNFLGTRLLFSPHWNKELRLPSLSVSNSRH